MLFSCVLLTGSEAEQRGNLEMDYCCKRAPFIYAKPFRRNESDRVLGSTPVKLLVIYGKNQKDVVKNQTKFDFFQYFIFFLFLLFNLVRSLCLAVCR